MTTSISLTVNGKPEVLQTDDPAMPLLYALRNQLGLHGMHFGCGLAQCGACTVHYNGRPLRSCVMPVSAVAGADIVTLEGLGTPERPHPLQQAFVEEQAAQCGYCLNGVVLTAKAFLDAKPKASDAELRQATSTILCRCFTHARMWKAIKRYAAEKA